MKVNVCTVSLHEAQRSGGRGAELIASINDVAAVPWQRRSSELYPRYPLRLSIADRYGSNPLVIAAVVEDVLEK